MTDSDLIGRAQRRVARVDAGQPTPDDDLICDLLIAVMDRDRSIEELRSHQIWKDSGHHYGKLPSAVEGG